MGEFNLRPSHRLTHTHRALNTFTCYSILQTKRKNIMFPGPKTNNNRKCVQAEAEAEEVEQQQQQLRQTLSLTLRSMSVCMCVCSWVCKSKYQVNGFDAASVARKNFHFHLASAAAAAAIQHFPLNKFICSCGNIFSPISNLARLWRRLLAWFSTFASFAALNIWADFLCIFCLGLLNGAPFKAGFVLNVANC